MDDLHCQLFIALLKAWDNYHTPMNAFHVRVWKCRDDDDKMTKGYFVAGITKTVYSFTEDPPSQTYDFGYDLPMKYWKDCNFIEVITLPILDPKGLERFIKEN